MKSTSLVIKNYIVQVTGKNQSTHNYFELPEELCKEMTEVIDQGKQYSESSRFVYSCNGVSLHKDTFQFGTAKAAVQSVISKYFGEGVKYLYIEKLKKQ